MNQKYNYKFNNFCKDNNIDIDFLDFYLDWGYKNRKWVFMDENSKFPAVKLNLKIIKNYANYIKEKDAYDYIENNFLLKHNLSRDYDDYDKDFGISSDYFDDYFNKKEEDTLKIIEKDLYKFYNWSKVDRNDRIISKIIFGGFWVLIIFDRDRFLSTFFIAVFFVFLLFSFEIVGLVNKTIIKIKMKNIAKAINKLKVNNNIPAIERQKRIIDIGEEEKIKSSLSGQVEYSNNGNPIILGVQLNKENFPELYKWAQTNPSRLIDQVKNVANKWHDGNYTSAIIALEVDLSHQ